MLAAVPAFLDDADRAVFVYGGGRYVYPVDAEVKLQALPEPVRAVIELPMRALLAHGTGFVRHVCAQGRFYGVRGTTSGATAAVILRHEPLPEGASAVFDAAGRLLLKTPGFDALWRLEDERVSDCAGLLALLESKRLLPAGEDRVRRKRWQGLCSGVFAAEDETRGLPDGRTIRSRFMPRSGGGAVWLCDDLTAGVVAERELNAARAGRRTLLDALEEGVAVFGSDGRAQLHNAAFARLNRVEEGAALAASLERWQQVDAGFAAGVAALVTGDAPRRKHQALLSFDEGTVHRISAVPLPDGTVLLSVADRTAESVAARALRERLAPLLDAEHAQRTQSAHLAYALRTPLNAVTGFADMLPLYGECTPPQLDCVRSISAAAGELAQQIDTLLDTLDVEATLQPCTAAVDLSELLQRCAAEAARRRPGSPITVQASDLTLIADVDLLRRALLQLLDNALKYTPAESSITLSAEADHDGGVRLIVRDTGRGVETDTGARLRRRGDGAGLGLRFVIRVCELHGGTFELRSAADIGAEAVIRLPSAPILP